MLPTSEPSISSAILQPNRVAPKLFKRTTAHCCVYQKLPAADLYLSTGVLECQAAIYVGQGGMYYAENVCVGGTNEWETRYCRVTLGSYYYITDVYFCCSNTVVRAHTPSISVLYGVYGWQ